MRQILPDAVQDPAVGEDSHVDVGHDDVVEVALAFVGEEQIGHPHFARVVQSQVLDAPWFHSFDGGTQRNGTRRNGAERNENETKQIAHGSISRISRMATVNLSILFHYHQIQDDSISSIHIFHFY